MKERRLRMRGGGGSAATKCWLLFSPPPPPRGGKGWSEAEMHRVFWDLSPTDLFPTIAVTFFFPPPLSAKKHSLNCIGLILIDDALYAPFFFFFNQGVGDQMVFTTGNGIESSSPLNHRFKFAWKTSNREYSPGGF